MSFYHDWPSSADIYITKSENLDYKLKLNCGRGSNTKEVILALCALLYFAKLKNLTRLQVVGYSQVITNWVLHNFSLQVTSLEGQQLNIRILQDEISSIQFNHIFQELTEATNSFSHDSLSLREGDLHVI